jgi:hypothetical protein
MARIASSKLVVKPDRKGKWDATDGWNKWFVPDPTQRFACGCGRSFDVQYKTVVQEMVDLDPKSGLGIAKLVELPKSIKPIIRMRENK